MVFWITTFAIIILDRLTKLLVVAKMRIGQTIPLIPGFFHITYVKNPGAAFGILAEKRWLFIITTLVILAVIIYLAQTVKGKSIFYLITLGMIAGGAVGNLIDRLQSGLVIDFLDFRGIWSYVFNLADAAVVVGVILLAWQILRTDME